MPRLRIPPRWMIVAPDDVPPPHAGDDPLVFLPGPGWGDGAHETTQLCLQALAVLRPPPPFRALDFGSGSGLLSIAAARLGATVEAVEIDEAAIAHAAANARANGVAAAITTTRAIAPAGATCALVVANILRAVLVDFAAPLVARLRPGGTLVLSGLVATDVPEVTQRYRTLLADAAPARFGRGEWRALAWRAPA
jgi:ribosomal protein L11 methyltransferase